MLVVVAVVAVVVEVVEVVEEVEVVVVVAVVAVVAAAAAAAPQFITVLGAKARELPFSAHSSIWLIQYSKSFGALPALIAARVSLIALAWTRSAG